MIHRDVKPSNILLDGKGHPKVSDFGLAKVEDALALTRTGAFAGTPFYMSPEQTLSSRMGIDHRTDIYSLGVTLYETLTLTRPFNAKTSRDVLKKIVFEDPEDPRKRNARIPRDLAVICLKALEKDPGRRYPTMKAFAEDLDRFLNGEVILARPGGPATWLIKRVRRNPLISGAVAVTVMVLVAFVIYLLWSYPRILEERRNYQAMAKNYQAMVQFLEYVMLASDVAQEGPDVRMKEVFDAALPKLESYFEGLPLVEASVLNLLGYVYQRLGELGTAEALHRKALSFRRDELGPIHEDTLHSMNDLGVTLLHLGGEANLREAEKLFENVIRYWSERKGEMDKDTLQVENNRASVFFQLGKEALKVGDQEAARNHFEHAVELMGEVVRKHEAALPPEDPNVYAAYNNLASPLMMLARYDEAEALLRKALAGRRNVLKPNDPELANTLISLATCLKEGLQSRAKTEKGPITEDWAVRIERVEEIRDLYKEALSILNERFDEDYTTVQNTEENLKNMEQVLIWARKARGREKSEKE